MQKYYFAISSIILNQINLILLIFCKLLQIIFFFNLSLNIYSFCRNHFIFFIFCIINENKLKKKRDKFFINSHSYTLYFKRDFFNYKVSNYIFCLVF